MSFPRLPERQLTPPPEPPDPDLSDALPCPVCGHGPEAEHAFGKVRLYCFPHLHGPWERDIVKAIEGWNYDVAEVGAERGDLEGENRKAAGVQQVAATNSEWMDFALEAIRELSWSKATFTSEHLRSMVPPPNHPNAFGAAFSTAAKQGLIERVGYQKNSLPSAHARVVAVWSGKR